ncbi:glycerophosphoryl diester phosphodiesterase family domain-containing protein [Ditylenchus destructor]|nr:glycerophosphoryl diester phosphodiesterase family domain-containing protein [Ditylenchus destructor]
MQESTFDTFLTLFLVLSKWPVVLLPMAFLIIVAVFNLKNKPAHRKNFDKFFSNFHMGGHRGSPIKEPENTIRSMEQAKADGVDLVEFDVSLTKDGVAVLLHDDTLERTTNLAGPIRQVLYKDLQKCNCAAKFHSDDSADGSTRILPLPTLDEMVRWAKANDQKMLFDVKDYDACLVAKLEQLFEEHDLYDVGIVCSFFPIVVWRLKHQNPRILTGLTWRTGFLTYQDIQHQTPRNTSIFLHYLALALDALYLWSVKSWLPSFLAADLVLTERSQISEQFVRQQECSGRKVCAWTVNDANEMDWLRNTLKIPFLTDKPHLATSLLNKKENQQ